MYLTSTKFSVILYFLSFILPVFKSDTSFLGFHAFVYSLMGLGSSTILLSILLWLANVAYFFTLVIFWGNKLFRFLGSIITIILALLVFLDETIFIVDTGDEKNHVLWYGYYCWLLSFIVLFSKSFVDLFMSNKKSELA